MKTNILFLVYILIYLSFFSISSQAQWVQSNGPNTNGVWSIIVNNNMLYAGTEGGASLSINNGTSWNQINSGMTNPHIYSFAIIGSNLFAANYDGGVFLSTDNGMSWNAVNSGLTDLKVLSLFVHGSSLFAGTVYEGIFLSTNNGISWSNVGSTVPGLSYVFDFAVIGTNIFAGTFSGGVFVSSDNGISWSAVNSGMTNLYVVNLVVSGTNIFAACWDGVNNNGSVFLSTNNGNSWDAVNSGLTNTNVLALASTGTSLFVGTYGGGVFLSTNNGTNWSQVNLGLLDPHIYCLAVSDTFLFAGTYGGFVWRRPLSEMITLPVELTSFTAKVSQNSILLNWITATETNNKGFEIERKKLDNSDWEKIGYVSGFGTTTESKSYSFSDNKISASIYSYRLKQNDFDGTFEYSKEIEVNVSIPGDFILSQNYPNPFNPSTTISYKLPVQQHVSLKVYDVLGNEVASLVNKEQNAGSYSIDFNAAQLGSGVYFYRINAGEFSETKSMILIK